MLLFWKGEKKQLTVVVQFNSVHANSKVRVFFQYSMGCTSVVVTAFQFQGN